MAHFQNIKQGTGRVFPTQVPAIWGGTEGASTCIATYCQVVGDVFVAHVDCGRTVNGLGDDYTYVQNTTDNLLQAELGAYNAAVHTNLQMFSAGIDDACKALQEGLRQWAGNNGLFLTMWDSFQVKTDGQGMDWTLHADVSTENIGPLNMRVPV